MDFHADPGCSVQVRDDARQMFRMQRRREQDSREGSVGIALVIGDRNLRKHRCKKCKGEKTVKEKTRQEIFIEKGMPDGYRIVLAGAGDQEVSHLKSHMGDN